MIEDIASIVVRRRKMVDRHVSINAEIKVQGADISARDNASLATAASTLFSVVSELRVANLIDDQELMRLVYRFAGETPNIEELLARGKAAGPSKLASSKAGSGAGSGAGGNAPNPQAGGDGFKPPKINLDPITGEPTNIPF